jgi:rieske iron-sulfur protein
MHDAPAGSAPVGWLERRRILALAVGLCAALPLTRRADAQATDARRARPQPNDRFVVASGERKGRIVALADIAAGGALLTAYPMDAATGVVRDESRLNQVLLVRLDPQTLDPDTSARAADGIVAYSAICTHTGCDAWDWQPAAGTVKCPCHFSEFDLKAGARVLNGPAPRRLPALPLKVADGLPVVAGAFTGRPGFETGGG